MSAAVAKKNEAELLSISEIAKRLKLDRATVRSRLEDLGYQAHESSTAKLQLFEFDGEMEFAVKAAKDSLTAAKIRDTRATYELKELKLARERGELVPASEMVDIVQRITSTLYLEYTQRMPKRIGNKLAKAKTPASVKAILKADSDRTMKMLRENFEAFLDQK
jgi:DNA-binding IclR family transcriptional regulator